MTFQELRLSEPIVRAVAADGYTTPTPIQSKAIPEALAGRDVLGCAQTGTGKTAAFALPILDLLSAAPAPAPARNDAAAPRSGNRNRNRNQPQGRRPRTLVLCPTRELATQIHESFCAYGRHLPLRHTVVFGGVGQGKQVRALDAGIDVLVATPGRLLDLMGQGVVDLGGIEILVLDEADRMLDMGFINDIRKIVRTMPQKRQTLLFSATMPDEIRGLADSILHRPVFVEATPVSTTVDAISQSVYHVERKNKPVLLERLIRRHGMSRTLVFTRTKYGADKVVRNLRRSGVDAGAIHGNKSQNARTRALDGFKSGKVPVLVATDIASRGIDVDEITHVVNYDVPNIPETYVHRIGRTARAGAEGIAFSFCDHEEVDHLRAIERLIRIELDVADCEPDLLHERPARSRKRTDQPNDQRSGQRSSRGPGAGGNRGRRGGGGRARSGRTARPASTTSNGRGRSRR